MRVECVAIPHVESPGHPSRVESSGHHHVLGWYTLISRPATRISDAPFDTGVRTMPYCSTSGVERKQMFGANISMCSEHRQEHRLDDVGEEVERSDGRGEHEPHLR